MCSSCEITNINGVPCHETGCPDAWKGAIIKCKWCGDDFVPKEKHQTCCSHTCTMAYLSISCDCIECNPPED
jgi:hypothetical protein